LLSIIRTILIASAVLATSEKAAVALKPMFYGHLYENLPAGSKINGLNIPWTRIHAERRCSRLGGNPKFHLRLSGEGDSHFQTYFHHSFAHVSLKIKVTVLDVNDEQPKFDNNTIKIRIDETSPLKSAVYKVTANDADQGKNANLVYFSHPASDYFFVVPKTGEIILLKSVLNLRQTIQLTVFAKDHGSPALVSRPLETEFSPRPTKLTLAGAGEAAPGLTRQKKSLLQPEPPLVVYVPEDARIGSVVTHLPLARFAAAHFELVCNPAEDCPVSVDRETGTISVIRSLDREREPTIEITVKIHDRT
uniref:Cadherin domain-containing protein n=1 Tax=Latimeria chalumnae TaxID=7897 RepID=H3AWM7_LATCH